MSGEIVTHGNIPTSFLYGLNKARIYKKANIFMYKILENIRSDAKIIVFG